VVSVPVLAHLFLDPATGLEYPQLFAAIVLLQLVPLTVGLIGQGTKWIGSPRTGRVIGVLSNVSFAFSSSSYSSTIFPEFVRILEVPVLAAVVGLILASLTAGKERAGREPSTRRSLGLISAARKGTALRW